LRRAHSFERGALVEGAPFGEGAQRFGAHPSKRLTSFQSKRQEQAREGGTPRQRAPCSRLAGTSFEGLHYKLEKKLGLYQVPCVFTCCSICFEISIYISISLTGFPHGGFSRVMLTKNTCVHLSWFA
jgi:hypothetical protein